MLGKGYQDTPPFDEFCDLFQKTIAIYYLQGRSDWCTSVLYVHFDGLRAK